MALVNYFLTLGVPLDVKTKDGTTPLMLACYGGQLDTVKKLVDLGANLVLKNNYGCDVSHWVAMGGSVPVAKYLLDLSVDFSV